MKTFWWKLTVEWPYALSEWLRAYLVVPLVAHLNRLTFKLALRIALQIIIFAVLLVHFEQVVSLDLTFLFYIDAAAYLEVATAVFVIVAQGHAGRVAGAVMRPIRPLFQNWSQTLRHFGARQHRNVSTLFRKRDAGSSKKPDEEPDVLIGSLAASLLA